ncbi:MAG: hypothetical protein WC871_02300 [Bacteroidales bacterium]
MVRTIRPRFNEVIVAFTEASGFDYSEFVRRHMFEDHVIFVDTKARGGEDWRNVAMRHALVLSYNAPYVWFAEQDFWPLGGFWEFVENQTADVIGVYQESRLHPCSLFMSRHALTQTHLDFAANPPAYDHFGRIQIDLKSAGIEPVKIPENLYYHYNGLSHNWRLVSEGLPANYQPEKFYAYLRAVLSAGLVLHPQFENTAREALERAAL